MELTNEFRVSVPIEEAWSVLTDLQRIAPCMPGATLQEVSGEDYLGTVKIKVGPITSSYKGKVRFTEKDDQAHRAVLRAEGRDTKGQGNASADIKAVLSEENGQTLCKVDMTLTISGRVAQFGRGVLADVSQKLVEQFVASLEQEVLSGDSEAIVPAVESNGATPAGVQGSEPSTSSEPVGSSSGLGANSSAPRGSAKASESVNAMGLIAKPVAKRALPVFAVLVVLGILVRRKQRGRSS